MTQYRGKLLIFYQILSCCNHWPFVDNGIQPSDWILRLPGACTGSDHSLLPPILRWCDFSLSPGARDFVPCLTWLLLKGPTLKRWNINTFPWHLFSTNRKHWSDRLLSTKWTQYQLNTASTYGVYLDCLRSGPSTRNDRNLPPTKRFHKFLSSISSGLRSVPWPSWVVLGVLKILIVIQHLHSTVCTGQIEGGLYG